MTPENHPVQSNIRGSYVPFLTPPVHFLKSPVPFLTCPLSHVSCPLSPVSCPLSLLHTHTHTATHTPTHTPTPTPTPTHIKHTHVSNAGWEIILFFLYFYCVHLFFRLAFKTTKVYIFCLSQFLNNRSFKLHFDRLFPPQYWVQF